MNVRRLFVCIILGASAACADGEFDKDPAARCVGGSVLNSGGECVLPDTVVDDLGLPPSTEVSNFAPSILPVAVALGAAAALGSTGGGGDTSATSGTR